MIGYGPVFNSFDAMCAVMNSPLSMWNDRAVTTTVKADNSSLPTVYNWEHLETMEGRSRENRLNYKKAIDYLRDLQHKQVITCKNIEALHQPPEVTKRLDNQFLVPIINKIEETRALIAKIRRKQGTLRQMHNLILNRIVSQHYPMVDYENDHKKYHAITDADGHQHLVKCEFDYTNNLLY